MFLRAGGERWSHWHTAAPPRLPECLSTELLMTDALGSVPPPDKKSLSNVKRAAQSHVHDLSSQYDSRCVWCVFLINISEKTLRKVSSNEIRAATHYYFINDKDSDHYFVS